MAFVKGADILIKVLPKALHGTGEDDITNYVPIAGQQGASFTRGSDNFSYMIKGDSWTYNEATYRNWELSANGLYVVGDTAFDELEDAFLNGDDVIVEVCLDKDEQPNSTYVWGRAIISDFSLDLPQDNMVGYSITLLGKGELYEVTIPTP